HDEVLVSRLLQEQEAPKALRHVGPADLLAVLVGDLAGPRTDVRAVDVKGSEREREVVNLDLLVQPAKLGLEDVDRDLELRERNDVVEPTRVAGHRLVELGEEPL